MEETGRRVQVSMRAVGKACLLLVIVYAIAAAAVSLGFLRKIESDAQYTQNTQIPMILSQNRNAIKVERLGSLVRSAFLARDRRIERQVQLQTQALAQSFTLDNDKTLSEGARRIADGIRQITAARQKLRDMPAAALAPSVGTRVGDFDARIAALEQEALVVYQDLMRLTETLGEHLSNDAAFVADNMSNDIQRTAMKIQTGWLIILTLPVLFTVAVILFIQRHILFPIKGAVEGLESIGRQQSADLDLRTPLFRELGVITDAVQAYGKASDDLRRTNAILRTLSDQDGLTSLANRRSFEKHLAEAFAEARDKGTDLSVMMIDLDHFKSINDVHGHQVGDTCLKMAADALKTACEAGGYRPARYGGEEFAVVLPGIALAEAMAQAETIRHAIHAQVITVPGNHPLTMTASIGVAALGNQPVDTPDRLVDIADKALYLAKHTGRNRVKSIASSADTGAIKSA